MRPLPLLKLAVLVVDPDAREEAGRDTPLDRPADPGAIAEAVGVARASESVGVVECRDEVSHARNGTPCAAGLPSSYGGSDGGNDRVPRVRPCRARGDADKRLPVLLRVYCVRRHVEAATGRLLRVLLVLGSGLPSEDRDGSKLEVVASDVPDQFAVGGRDQHPAYLPFVKPLAHPYGSAGTSNRLAGRR